MDDPWQARLAEFRGALASSAPTPGCGAAAAVVADLGLALVAKALRISQAHGGNGERSALLAEADRLLGRPGRFAEDDMQAFTAYLRAAQQDDAALAEAARQACAVPLATAHSCLQGLEVAVAAWPLAAGSLQSDVEAGARLLHVALTAVLLNVDANLAPIRPAADARRARAARQRLQGDADDCLARLVSSQSVE
ncbi:cyclodeaminase/cyclohydrolase family protein [Pseudomonas oligotrophica]|uniref:cyclodeaminase/cyclohydrolase family protein n=1 Tax=Pseudomonas oligotrophica TaxID=2912055 RepID=UPI001F2C5A71|nr:cyclodeaminase/cyclohydrolase family protein [Pseudomonas oligotrophica]MCF7201425.1 cyclodeaminase/cyclohydrolase family protein [Pseudomonas oligotrophica]